MFEAVDVVNVPVEKAPCGGLCEPFVGVHEGITVGVRARINTGF